MQATSMLRQAEGTEAYRQAARTIRSLRDLRAGWDSYGAQAPDAAVLDAALSFYRDAVAALLAMGIDAPAPFAVPMATGGVQFEWEVGGRGLELEIMVSGDYRCLAVGDGLDEEGEVKPWEALGWVRWVPAGAGA
ncbi:MAG: hypothetical protein AB1505_22275 [Candidatus Latescibacterota bacterium]